MERTNGDECRLWVRLARCDFLCCFSMRKHRKFHVSACIQQAHYILYCAEYNFEFLYCSSEVYPFQSCIIIEL